jgi:hypothetical protein
MWTIVLRDGTGAHALATTTQVDKALYPTQQEAIQQALVQLGVIAVGPHCWWEVY